MSDGGRFVPAVVSVTAGDAASGRPVGRNSNVIERYFVRLVRSRAGPRRAVLRVLGVDSNGGHHPLEANGCYTVEAAGSVRQHAANKNRGSERCTLDGKTSADSCSTSMRRHRSTRRAGLMSLRCCALSGSPACSRPAQSCHRRRHDQSVRPTCRSDLRGGIRSRWLGCRDAGNCRRVAIRAKHSGAIRVQ
jgi:hypothetical protein